MLSCINIQDFRQLGTDVFQKLVIGILTRIDTYESSPSPWVRKVRRTIASVENHGRVPKIFNLVTMIFMAKNSVQNQMPSWKEGICT